MQIRTRLDKNGQLPSSFYSTIERRAREQFEAGGHLVVTVHRVPPKKQTEHIRRYYWSLLRLIHRFLIDSGYNEFSLDDVHELMKEKFMRREFVDYLENSVYTETPSTTILEQQEWYEVLENIKHFWAEKGLNLPDRGAGTYE